MAKAARRLIVAFLIAVSLAGCRRNVETFRVEMPPTTDQTEGVFLPIGEAEGAKSIGLHESPGQSADEEGLILRGTGATPVYTLRRAHRTPADGELWAFAVEDAAGPLTIGVYDNEGRIVASRTFADPRSVNRAGSPVRLVAALSIPGDVSVRSFQLRGERGGTETQDRNPRLVGVAAAIAPGGSAIGVKEIAGTLVLGADSVAAAWGEGGNGGTEWLVTRDASADARAGRDPAAPVVVEYRYDPPESTAGGVPERGDVRAAPVPPRATVRAGPVGLQLEVRPGTHRVILYAGVFGGTLDAVTVRASITGFRVTGIVPLAEVQSHDSLTPGPLPADLGTVYSYPPALWRDSDFELFRWSLFPDVLVMDTRDYEVQSRFFKRIAFFVEKEGFRGHVLPDAELEGRHGYNAHNYRGEGLAAFFNAAAASNVQLSDEEILLRRILEAEGIIVVRGGRYESGVGGILSVSQESRAVEGLRRLLLTHEAYHGVYYSSERYVTAVAELWGSLTDDERRYWRLLLDGMHYDVADDYLLENEFQAYLLQQSADLASWYFEQRGADRLRSWKPAEAGWLNEFLAANTGIFRQRALELNGILFSLSGLVGGDVFGLAPVSPQS